MISTHLTTGVLARTLDSMTPAVGAEVMGTGIVSIALSLDGLETLSRGILAIAAVIWVAFALLLPLRAARDLSGFRADARTPAALTAPAATAVLGSRLTSLGWTWAGLAALVIALVLWAALLGPVLAGWKSPTVGVSLLLAVSAESLAVLAALRMVGGLEDITEGNVRIGERIVNDLSPKSRDIAMVFQSYALYPHLSVADNIGFALKTKRVPKEEIRRRVLETARMLDLEPYLKRKPRAL